jgi:hypothetical protein
MKKLIAIILMLLMMPAAAYAANVTIFGLPSATTPLSGDELIPIWQDGVTKQCTVTDLGATGPSGPTGPTGPSGAAGATGPTGIDGVTGAIGPTGPTGIDGATGPTGAAGADGATGPTGPTGETGVAGATGPTGADGSDGAAGATGPTGADGAAGVTGPTGADGATGPTGANGSDGVTGPTGADGADGATGPTGANGAAGATGPTGSNGAGGATGPTGSNGAAGATGPTGTQYPWMGAWNSGTANYYVNDCVYRNGSGYVCIQANGSGAPKDPATETAYWSLLVSKGDTGATGPTGSNGSDGATGPTGANGSTGATGPTGPTGSATGLTIKEIDNSPSGTPTTLKVTNGTLTDNGDGSFTLTIGAGSGTPGGSDTQVQFNDGGAFGGDTGFIYNKTTKAFSTPKVSGAADYIILRQAYLTDEYGTGWGGPVGRTTSGNLILDLPNADPAGNYIKCAAPIAGHASCTWDSSVGPTGPTGPTGSTGASGATGPTGAAGATGPTGAAGAIGATGPSNATEVDGHTDATNLTDAQISNTTIHNVGQGANAVTLNLPSLTNGRFFSLDVGEAQTSHRWRIKVQSGQYIYLLESDGTTITKGSSGGYIGVTSPAIGNMLACKSFKDGASSVGLQCKVASGTWTQE